MISRLLSKWRAAPIAVRLATADDAAAIAMVHGLSFRRGWSDIEFERLLVDRTSLALVATRGKGRIAPVVGFVLARLVAGEAEILSIAVAPQARGTGLGKLLLAQLVGHLRQLHAGAILLEVDLDNAPALALYRQAGFRSVGSRPGYYRRDDGTAAEAAILRCELA